jgi:spermidine synthase
MSNSHRLIILLAFTASGCAGLIYESVWSHYLGLYLGHAAYAQTLTLGIFMGGMTLGAYIVSRYIGRIRNALLGYAVVELLLGVAGLLFHVIFTTVIAFSYDTVFPSLGSAGLIDAYKWISGAMIILPQSILLGSTFPLLCSALIRREQQGLGKHISVLYFTNSIGAAAGALIATFLLIPEIGMPGAMLTSGLINIGIALVTYLVAKQPEEAIATGEQDIASEAEGSASKTKINQITMVALITAAITGAVSFMYEIAWIRMLNLVLGTSLHAFEIMLSAFIAGLALGGWWIRNRIDKIPDLLRFTGQVQIFMGLAAISTLTLYVESFHWVAELLNSTLLKTDTGYVFYNLATSLLSGLIMIPATFCAGMTLPLLTTHLIREGHNENAIGRVYASNTIGAIIGIVFAVHIGMTTFGLKWLIVVAGFIDIGLGVYLIFSSGRSLRWVSLPSRAIAAGLVALAGVSLMTELSPSRLASGTFRYGRVDTTNEVLFYKDGKTASISVVKGGENSATIQTNGKPDAGLRIDPESDDMFGDEVTMAMLGSIALLVDPTAQNIANIGFGSGFTSHVVLSSDTVKSLDTIEIEPEMVEGARLFLPRNRLAFEDSRSNIHIDDAKTFFAAQQKKYDVIISEPSNPWVTGVGNLFTVEFYEHLKRYLEDDGLLVQWLHLYEISMPTVLTALNALNQAFPNYELYAMNGFDILIVATPNASTDISIKTNWEQLPAGLKTELEQVGLTSIELVKSRKIATRYEIDALIAANNASPNSDYFPLLSLNAPRDRFKESNSMELYGLQVLGISDFPFRNRNLAEFNQVADTDHPYGERIALSQGVSRRLLQGSQTEDLNFSIRGKLETLRFPQKHCGTPNAAITWVQAFHDIAIPANNFGSPEFRQKLLEYANQFDCTEKLPPAPKAVFNAVMMSLTEFDEQATTELRNSLITITGSDIAPRYHAFIVSCYLISMLKEPDLVQQADLDMIASLRGAFDPTNLWLEALLAKQLARPNS